MALQFLLEGQEEIGSPNLAELLQENAELLKADFALSADGGQISPEHVISPVPQMSMPSPSMPTVHACQPGTTDPSRF